MRQQRLRELSAKVFMDAAEAQQIETPTAEPPQPRPVVPIILSSEKPGDKVKEITARLEQGIQAVFDSDRYKEFLTAMSKFHDYSLNNTILSYSLKQAEKQLKQYNDASDSLYLDWKSGEITKEEYRRLKGKIAEQIQQLEANISYLKEEMQIMADGIGADDPYLTAFLKYKNIQSLNRGIVVELIKAVWVHENGEITVDFNFAEEYQRIIDYIENNHNIITVIESKAI